MRRVLTALFLITFLSIPVAEVQATPYGFEDEIFFDSGYIGTGDPMYYLHDLNDDVDFGAGDVVTDATLELIFAGEEGDSFSLRCDLGQLVLEDTHEFAVVGFDYDAGHWSYVTFLGEIDDGQYDVVVGVEALNDDGILEVGIGVWNFALSADVYLEGSTLYGVADSAPVPEPGTMLLLGTGLLGLAGLRRRKTA